MLHTLMSSPFQCDLSLLLRMLVKGDDLLLLQDGVIAALDGSPTLALLLTSPATVYVLQQDVEARGLVGRISYKVKSLNYNGFVELTINHSQQMSW